MLWWQIRRKRLSERVEAFALPGTHLESPVEELEGVPETPHGGSPRALRVCIVGAVRHEAYCEFTAEVLGAQVTDNGLIADLKGMWRHIEMPPGVRRWNL